MAESGGRVRNQNQEVLDMKLRGQRTRCPTCGTYFNTTRLFDRHRVGSFPPKGERRCLSIAEMLDKGWSIGMDGFWRGEKRRSV